LARKQLELEEKTERRKEKAEKPRETPPEFIASMASVLVVGLFIITFCMQAFEIPSSSMENTLLIGDHLFVDRVTPAPATKWFPVIPYRDIHRDDIVVFVSPAEPGLYVVKRVVGVPGDRLRLRDGVLFRNGQRVDEPFAIRTGSYAPYRDDFPSVRPDSSIDLPMEWRVLLPQYVEGEDLVVPPDRYFAMGDNRDWSYDSRFWGFIPRENIIGRPMIIYWSFETPKDQYMRTGMADRIAHIGNVIIHFFDRTRWDRMLKLVR